MGVSFSRRRICGDPARHRIGELFHYVLQQLIEPFLATSAIIESPKNNQLEASTEEVISHLNKVFIRHNHLWFERIFYLFPFDHLFHSLFLLNTIESVFLRGCW